MVYYIHRPADGLFVAENGAFKRNASQATAAATDLSEGTRNDIYVCHKSSMLSPSANMCVDFCLPPKPRPCLRFRHYCPCK